MGRILALVYGVISYLVFFLTFLYAIAFVGNCPLVPRTIDTNPHAATLTRAIIANVILLSIFAIQHSVMARPSFKRIFTKVIPAAIERSTFVLLSSLALLLMFCQWRSITSVVWNVQTPALQFVLWGVFAFGWLMVLLSTFLINHFDLFGLRQVYLYMKSEEYSPVGFKEIFLYKFVRHPIMLGFIIAFWATPLMTYGHLLFAVVTTIYILVAIQLEERNIAEVHGADYDAYRSRVSMIVPMPPRG
ncbi:isoprenylcysteine carboxylmethyltransferase family protein [soil metagenome]